jgi:hypothetical protein
VATTASFSEVCFVIFMCSLHDVPNMNTSRAAHLCLSVKFHLENC